MPLYIKDDEVDALATELQAISGARSKTEAVRRALQNEISRTRAKSPADAIREAQAMARAMGVRADPGFDFKAFSDELSGGI